MLVYTSSVYFYHVCTTSVYFMSIMSVQPQCTSIMSVTLWFHFLKTLFYNKRFVIPMHQDQWSVIYWAVPAKHTTLV